MVAYCNCCSSKVSMTDQLQVCWEANNPLVEPRSLSVTSSFNARLGNHLKTNVLHGAIQTFFMHSPGTRLLEVLGQSLVLSLIAFWDSVPSANWDSSEKWWFHLFSHSPMEASPKGLRNDTRASGNYPICRWGATVGTVAMKISWLPSEQRNSEPDLTGYYC